MNYLFNEVGIHRISAKHDIENPASGKVMQKCNMTYEGRLREHYLRHDGTYSDALTGNVHLKAYF
ncbi:MAG TPA: GNAT family protein [Defluviitaleaceae bacterium]|jgi:ribosomal-protein-alanine N-acetyltransferase|nr:GNAT family protein [Defluviitaleaceae bacterium]